MDWLEVDTFVDDVLCGVLQTKSSGAVSWASGSTSFVRTWMQKEPRQCPCVGSTSTRAMRNNRSRLIVREIKMAMKKSDVPTAAELLSAMAPLESVKALLTLFVSQSRIAVFDISRAHFHGVPVRSVFVEHPDEETERLARDDRHDLSACRESTCVDASGRWQAHRS